MGRNSSDGQMKWMELVLYGTSFLRVILNEMNYYTDEGIILVADDETQVRRFLSEYCRKTQGNGVEVFSWKKRRRYPDNFCCGFLYLKKTMQEEEIIEFLSEKEFLPVILSGGILPEYLRDHQYIFRMSEEEIENVGMEQFGEECAKFQTYIVDNVPEVLRTLEELHTSIAITEYIEKVEQRQIFKCIIAVGAIYAKYLRRVHSERDVAVFFEKYIDETLERLQHISDFATGEEIATVVSFYVWMFMDKNRDVILADVDAVDGKAYSLLKKKRAILFDEAFYYFPHDLFMEICEKLLETMSKPELKERLEKADILYRNSVDKTVKKTITVVYGVQERVRFLWVYKEFLLSPDNLRLEDVFGND